MSTAPEGTSVALSRNRNYQLLWISQVLSGVGLSASVLAFPLLVLALTGSAAASGLVLGSIAAGQLLAGLPAGALVDRWDRKKIMLGCEATQVIAAVSLVAVLWWDVAHIAHLVVVAVVMGVCGALFSPAENACLPRVVPAEQLSTAVALNAARTSVAQLSGTAAGGFLFAVARFVPFLADALAHALACALLAFLRVPPREVPREPTRHLGREIVTGLRWVWGHRHIRVTALCAVVLNAFFSAFYVIVIVLAVARGVPSGQIGIMAAMLGGGGLLGALVAARLSALVSPYVSIIAVFWVIAALTPLAAFLTSGYLLGALLAAMAVLPATANTAIITRQLLLTPDDLRGRLSSVLGIVTGVAATLGPVLGGLLAAALPGTLAVLVCAGGIAAAALVATLSPTLRSFPPKPVVPSNPG
ncbi:MAG TPA: MFS transporter [Pseudonocardiaceae bacterium]|nr:MFS transporter [Pseudonocardiaceae bacterium]